MAEISTTLIGNTKPSECSSKESSKKRPCSTSQGTGVLSQYGSGDEYSCWAARGGVVQVEK